MFFFLKKNLPHLKPTFQELIQEEFHNSVAPKSHSYKKERKKNIKNVLFKEKPHHIQNLPFKSVPREVSCSKVSKKLFLQKGKKKNINNVLSQIKTSP